MNLPEPEAIAGQMILAGLRENQLKQDYKELLSKGHISGFVLFPKSPISKEELKKLTQEIYSLSKHHPPLIAIDQEGGRVSRLKEPFTQFPPMRAIGEKNDESLAFEIGKTLGKELKEVGINLNFAPVLDLDLNPKNQVIGDRAFHSDPEIVAHLGSALIRGMHSQKILTCAKHFPGHGASKADSHLELPVVEIDKKILLDRELIPFKKAIEEGVDSIMLGHLLYPRIDKYHPASLSEKFISEILREELGFQGLVFTDSLEMSALGTIPMPDRAFMAIRAGADMVLCTKDLTQIQEVHFALTQAIMLSAIPLEKVYLAFERIIKLKEKIQVSGFYS